MSDDQYLGEIRLLAGPRVPKGWILCDGSTLLINEHQALFSLIGTTYGGDGQRTFDVPDLRGRIPIHAGINPNTNTRYPLGQSGGTETVTLTADQLPTHTHTVNVNISAGTSYKLGNMYFASSNINQYSSNAANSVLSNKAVRPNGGSQSHDNMMPFLVLNFVMALEGIYPIKG